MTATGETPSQTVGPYFSMILASDDTSGIMIGPQTPGEHITLRGHLLDGNGTPIDDGLVEVWQADPDGRYAHPDDPSFDGSGPSNFTGFGRCRTTPGTGTFEFQTVRPGPVAAPDGGWQAPHLSVIVQARGMLNPAWTRVYLSDQSEENAADKVLRSVPVDRRETMVAARDETAPTAVFDHDIRVQGPDETVFLDW